RPRLHRLSERPRGRRAAEDSDELAPLHSITSSALGRQNDAEQNALVRTHLSRSADVSATIGCDHVIDLVVGNRRPSTVHFYLVVVTNDATLGRPTIHQIAAQTSVVSSEF